MREVNAGFDFVDQVEPAKPLTAVGVVIFRGNCDCVLLVEHGKAADHPTGILGLPAGKAKAGETDEMTGARELTEETGLTAQCLAEFLERPYEGTIRRKDGIKETGTFHVFMGIGFDGELRATDETTPFWFAVSDVPKLDRMGLLLPNVSDAILRAKEFYATLKKEQVLSEEMHRLSRGSL